MLHSFVDIFLAKTRLDVDFISPVVAASITMEMEDKAWSIDNKRWYTVNAGEISSRATLPTTVLILTEVFVVGVVFVKSYVIIRLLGLGLLTVQLKLNT